MDITDTEPLTTSTAILLCIRNETPERIERNLETMLKGLAAPGIGEHFHASVSAKSLGVAKPDVRIFIAGAEAAGVAPHEVLHIGDDAHLDCVGALAAGMQVAWVNREGHAWLGSDTRPHVEVRDLRGLCACWPDCDL